MNRNVVVEFAASISEEDLRYIACRLSDRLQGDVAEALSIMGRSKAMDTLLSGAKSADDLYRMCDQIGEILWRECKKKGMKENS